MIPALIAVLSVLSSGAVFWMFRASRLPEWLPIPYPVVVAPLAAIDYSDEWRGMVE